MKLNLDEAWAGALRELLVPTNRIVLTTHHNPDGDAVGSVLGLWHILEQVGVHATAVTPNDFPDFLSWMPGSDTILRFSSSRQKVREVMAGADIIICLDYNGFSRTEDMESLFSASSAKKILIDHHPQPENTFDLSISVVEVSSTSELVFELATEIYGLKAFNADAATCLYAGIMTDTGSFSYACSRGRTLEIAGMLVDSGAVVERIQSLVYNNFSADRMKLLGYCLADKMMVFPEFHAAYIWLTREELKRFNYQMGDTEGLVNYPLSIKGIIFSVIFVENDNHIKVSLRSRGNFSVNEFARKYYNGGGHLNAAGGKSFQPIDATLADFEQLLRLHLQELNAAAI
ncbi:MAG TPA: bifunctional oligoribonuclease/PAP phosphatase NrnA [Tenuifilaceae bacterium]|nr:bifunctional oligoribonuclease/PAP phosphatase NrnA [Tenuifilaceae bacterium]